MKKITKSNRFSYLFINKNNVDIKEYFYIKVLTTNTFIDIIFS